MLKPVKKIKTFVRKSEITAISIVDLMTVQYDVDTVDCI